MRTVEVAMTGNSYLRFFVVTIKSRSVDRSTIQFLTIFGVLLTKTCYYPRRATIAQGLLYLDGRNSQNSLHQDQADF